MIGLLMMAAACTDGTTTGDTATSSTTTGTWVRPAADCPTPAGTPTITSDWEALPLAPAGDVVGFATSAADPERVYAVSAINGPFRSDDRGLSWQGLDSVVTHVLSQPLVSHTDPDLVFHSVGELYRSRDGGESWEGTGVGDRFDFQRYVKGLGWLEDDLLVVDASGRVFRSEDGGESFSEISQIGESPRHKEFYVKDDGWWQLVGEDGVMYAARHSVGVWRSSDRGETWEDLSGYRQVEVASLGVDGDRVWYADSDGLQVSDDQGGLFTAYTDASDPFVATTLAADGGLLASTAAAIWRLDADGLAPWSVPEMPPDSGILSAFTLADGTVVLGHEQGILRSDDHGATWSDSDEGLLDDDLAVVLAHSECQDFLFVGTQCESGGYTTTDGGDTLDLAPAYMHYVMVAKEDPFDPNGLWVTSDDRVHRSGDLGRSWEDAVPDSLDVHFHGLDLDPWHQGTALVGSVGSGTFADDRPRVYRTDDDGLRWRDSSDGLPEGEWSVHALHFSREVEGVVLMGSFRGGDIAHNGAPGVGLFRSTDSGWSWSEVAVDGVEDVAFFAECDGRTYAATTVGVIASDDAGETWTPTWAARTQTLSVACSGDVVLALDQVDGLVRSDDRGGTWSRWDDELFAFGTVEDQYIVGLAISPDGATAWAALRGDGLFRRGL